MAEKKGKTAENDGKQYQGYFVGVKEFKTKVYHSWADAISEAQMETESATIIPVILDIAVAMSSWLMISLFYGINQKSSGDLEGVSIISHFSNTLKYSYNHEILHNDIKTDNITNTIGLNDVQSYISSSVVVCGT